MVFEKVRTIIAEQLGIEENKIKEDTDIKGDLDADSLDVVDIIMSFEDEFEMEFPDEQAENIKTVGDIVRYIEEQKNDG
jgi:acyl carrier protein